jgi:hypothetical protein
VLIIAVCLRVEAPAVQHRDAVSRVAQRDGQVDDQRVLAGRSLAGTDLGHRAAAGDFDPFRVTKVTLRVGSSRREVVSTGRSWTRNCSRAILAIMLDDLTAENVATARTSVPSAVARLAMVLQAVAVTGGRAPA